MVTLSKLCMVTLKAIWCPPINKHPNSTMEIMEVTMEDPLRPNLEEGVDMGVIEEDKGEEVITTDRNYTKKIMCVSGKKRKKNAMVRIPNNIVLSAFYVCLAK